MKFPKPRLRQVFEHSTHFKVVSPGGKNVTIAKKALSPQLTTRLRRFAQGGEVGHYAKGIEASDEAEAEAVANVAAGNAAMAQAPVEQQPLEEVPPQTFEMTRPEPTAPRRPVAAAAATGTAETAEEFARRDRERIAAQSAPVAPAPAQTVTVTVSPSAAPSAPAPASVTAKTEAPAEKPTEAAPAAPEPTAPAAPRRGPQIVTEQLAPPPVDVTPAPAVTIPSVEFVGPPEAPAPAPMGRFLAQPGLLTPLAAPAPTPAAAPIAAPVAALAPTAPVAAPAVTPAGLLSPSPMLPPVPPVPEFKPVTVEQVRKEMVEVQKATPDASQPQLIQSAVSNLTGGLTLPPLELQAIADLSKQEPKQIIDEAIRDRINAKQTEAQAAFQTAVEQAQFADQQYKEALAKATRQQIAIEELEKRAADLRANAEANDDIKSFWGGQGFWRSVLGIAALAVSGYTAGYAGTENFAYKAFENAVARDVDEQKRKRNNRWKQYEDILGDKQDAAKLYGADLKEVTAAELERMAKTGAVRMVGPRYNELITQIRESAYKDRIALALKEEGLDIREMEAEAKKTAAERPRAAPRVAGPKPPTPSQELAREVFETGRTVNVGTIPVQRSSSTGSKDIDINLANRNFAVKSLKEGVRLLEKMDVGDFSDFTGDKRAQAIAKLAYAVENFPQAFGYTRAVSRNAAIQLKEGLRNPTEAPNILKQLIARTDDEGRKASTGLRVLRDEAIESRQAFVRQLPVAGSLRDKEAAEYGLYLLEKGENEPLGLRAPPKPKLTIPVDELERTPYQRKSSTASVSAAPADAAPSVSPAGVDVRSFLRRK